MKILGGITIAIAVSVGCTERSEMSTAHGCKLSKNFEKLCLDEFKLSKMDIQFLERLNIISLIGTNSPVDTDDARPDSRELLIIALSKDGHLYSIYKIFREPIRLTQINSISIKNRYSKLLRAFFDMNISGTYNFKFKILNNPKFPFEFFVASGSRVSKFCVNQNSGVENSFTHSDLKAKGSAALIVNFIKFYSEVTLKTANFEIPSI